MDLQGTTGAEGERVVGSGPRDSLERAYGAEVEFGKGGEIQIELKTGVRLRFSTSVALDYVVELAQRLG